MSLVIWIMYHTISPYFPLKDLTQMRFSHMQSNLWKNKNNLREGKPIQADIWAWIMQKCPLFGFIIEKEGQIIKKLYSSL